MPRIILHIGMPKTGTTALQRALTKLRPDLVRAGALYPEPVYDNHDILSVATRDFEFLSRQYQQIYNGDPIAAKSDFDRWWSRTLEEITTTKPDLVLFSGEALFSDMGAKELRDLLGQISSEIVVVAYIRRPSSFFLSHLQQHIKASRFAGPYEPMLYRTMLEHFAESFDCEVSAYDRSSLIQGDTITDFFSRFVPQFGLQKAYTAQRSNESLSAEAMALIQDFKRATEPGQNRIYTPETHYLLAAIRSVDAFYPPSRPVLKPGLADLIDHSDPDLLWLRQRYGVTFSGLDYDKVGTMDASSITCPETSIEDICEVDADARAKLTFRVIHNLAKRANLAAQR